MRTRMPCPADPGDDALLEALRAGDEAAFAAVVQRWRVAMLRVALRHVRGRAVAEEVVQETWLSVLRGLPAFQGRSTLRTWVFAILVNRAKTRGLRERRSVPFSAVSDDDLLEGGATARAWAAPSAEARAVERETLRELRAAI